MMTLSDDTTTIPNLDTSEDKMQILSKRELREYFDAESKPQKKALGGTGSRFLRYIKNWFS